MQLESLIQLYGCGLNTMSSNEDDARDLNIFSLIAHRSKILFLQY